jgi:hypothetical protein
MSGPACIDLVRNTYDYSCMCKQSSASSHTFFSEDRGLDMELRGPNGESVLQVVGVNICVSFNRSPCGRS